ncbi:MAG: flavodoxin [Deltaproteobacteria bacterium]|jgi:flavodoxin|nr:flavodoxin [Deltaproteobacteria bacterium]
MMKYFGFLAAALLALSMAASPASAEAVADSDTLLVLFSMTGNTKAISDAILAKIDAETANIEVATPYPADRDTLLETAKQEINDNFKPALKTRVADIGKYKTVLLGYPIWWSNIPPPVASFLADHDLTGKVLVPFATHGGGGLGQSVASIEKLAPNSEILKPFAARGGSRVSGADIDAWLAENGLLEK